MSNEYCNTLKNLEKVLAKKKQVHIKHRKKALPEQDWIYLLHHLHPPKRAQDMEIVHHCVLFEKKNLKGRKFPQKHVKDGKFFQHALDIEEKEVDSAPKVVYCHLNNSYKIGIKEIDGKKYAIFTGMVSLKKTKWSDQDKGELYE